MPDLVAQAIAALQHEDFVSARDCIAAHGRSKPLELRHYLIRGLAELALKDWRGAAATFGAAASRHPGEAQIWLNLGLALENMGDPENAALSYERSLGLRPDQAEGCGNLSNVYCRLGRFAEAETMARQAIELGVSRAEGLNSLGLALNRQHKFEDSEASFAEATRLEPDHSLVWTNFANLAVDQLEFSRAWPRFARARAAGDGAARACHHEGIARLLAGDYEAGWRLYEARLDLPGSLRSIPPCPRYRGESLAGKKLMLVAEQGFGDVIQFCRYGALLEKSGVDIVWTMPHKLLRLLAANLPGRVLDEADCLPEADYYLPILSLPLALNVPEPERAPPAPYVRAAPRRRLLLRHSGGEAEERRATPEKIGLVWAGSRTHARDFERSIPLARFAPFLEKIPARVYAPFTGAGLEQIENFPVTRLDHMITDFADTASLLGELDCLVTVDTATAHLAGALGVKTFLLLPFCPDWRWGLKGKTTPWYPSLTLLRQTRPGDWDGVIRDLINLLSASRS